MSIPRQSEAFVSIDDARLYPGKCLLTEIDEYSDGVCIPRRLMTVYNDRQWY